MGIKPKTSAFKAVNDGGIQIVPAGPDPTDVEYPNVLFDLNEEYDPEESTFIPNQDGIYLVIGSVVFAQDLEIDYRVRIFILVNGEPAVGDNDFWGKEVPFANGVSVSGILQLNKGDRVSINVNSTADGVIVGDPVGTHFEAARFPSPLENESPILLKSSNTSKTYEL
ncbi:hypothetical protein SM124_14260 [Bacillus sp. 31A1R]|uniref:C1q domain-containing protein n=1 Tax=Robertmurraya mangrovi TaxID=3098077 RepID=A0ABU5J0F1_9BACI|nr:hypothetical protein [Bacillus sp. 31A1R]MDZ5472893.1 hypothetical protein [Bacillus sp. 31A1R]